MLRSVEYDVVDNEDFNRKVCISLDNKSNDIPLTCKAAWIRLHRILKDKSDYDAVFCKRIFARPNSSDDLICKLSVGETSSEAIAASIDWAVREFELVEKEINLLWRQVFLIFAYSVYEGFAKANPIDNVLTKIDKFAKERRNFGASMVEKSFNREQECAYVADQYKIADNLGYRIGALIRLFSGISTSELCALVWDDYYKLLGYDCNVFEITKYFADKSTEVIYHINRNKIRQHPAVTEICDLIDLWKEKSEIQLANYGIDAKDFGKYPIIHPDNEPTKAITPDNFRHYLNKLLEKFGPEDLFLNLSDGKGSKKAINVSKYGGDFLRENFRYQLYTYAGMDESEVDYLLGNMQKTTLEKYYLGFVKPTRLLEMRDKLDRWVASGMEKYSCFDNSIQKFSVSRSRRTINLQKTSFQTELEMRIKIPKDMNYIQYHIHSSNGCDVSFEFIKEDK